MKNFTLKLISALFVSFLLIFIFHTGLVRANGIIYIRADGSVEGTDKILKDGDLYTFTDNIINQSIIVEKDNVVVDGAGYTLGG